MQNIYKVSKLSNKIGNVAFYLATLVTQDFEEWQMNTLYAFSTSFNSEELFDCPE